MGSLCQKDSNRVSPINVVPDKNVNVNNKPKRKPSVIPQDDSSEEKDKPENFFKAEQFKRDDILLKELNRRFRGGHRKKTHKKEEEGESQLSEEETKRNQILSYFDRFDKWDFDVLELSKLTNGYPLFYCGYVFLIKYELLKKFSIDEELFLNFLEKVQSLYNNNNQFNNCTRSASILQSFHFLLRKGLGEFVSETELISALISCIIVYLVHPGLDNNYQNNSEAFMSTIYNDLSCLENVACYQFVKLVYETEEYNIFKNLTKKQKKEIREIVLDMVIATDMETNKQYVRLFAQRVENNSDFSSKEDIRILLQIALKFCSLDYCFKPLSQYVIWIKQKLIQFFCQGDIEKIEKLPVKPMYNREKNENKKISKEQLRFLDSQIKPLIKPFCEVFSKMKFVTNQVRKIKDYWINKFKRDDCMDFDDVMEYKIVGVKQQQIRLLEKYRSFPVAEDQAKNVPLEIQKTKFPRPDEIDRQVFQTCIDKLEERWDIKRKNVRKPYTELPKIYAIVDYSKNQKYTKEERIDSITKMFDKIDEWNFDCFCLEMILNDDCLILVSYILFVKYDFLTKFKIPKEVLLKFLRTVKLGYQRNPYHNAKHATDVMQITNSICCKGGVIEKMTNEDLIAAIVSSLVHDLDHPGLNDAFQVHSFSYLAKLYNDRSVLEAHHCAETFRLMREDGLDIFKNMTPEQRRDVRKTMVEMIISTDMCNHAKYVKEFNRLIEEESQFRKKRDIRIALQIVIKMADVSNPSRPTYLYLQWTDCIIDEFFRQGDKEKLYGLPISPLMDREKSVISKGQMAFMEYVLFPMFKSFSSVFPKFEYTLPLIEKNREYWKKNNIIDKDYFYPTEEQRKCVQSFIEYEIGAIHKKKKVE